ncbi:MAG: sigma-54-dependent Fis family transcriptional regulator [Pirellulales bacterium]|nr:sigma-54-dependent Fis family transcriptional regulator [Pirellulales bacterium]
MSHLLIIDDEQSICWGLAKLAESMGHTVSAAASAERGLEAAKILRPDAVVLDVRLPGMDGLTAMRHLRELSGAVPIIVITAFGDLTTAVRAVRQGAFEYLLKPFDLQVARRAIGRALEKSPPENEAGDIAPEKKADYAIVGRSPAMQDVYKQIAAVAHSEACVHLVGESGSGKELAARAIHRYSRRSKGPFVAVNVAALSPSLIESELFGHARGSFTGADTARRGLLEKAHCGTIFLDEIADIPLSLQVKLLRTLEHGEILPVGGESPVTSNFRLISATHQNLRQLVAEGKFRHDLYFRLITFEIEIPPLRRRAEDIPELADHFLDSLSAKNGLPRPCIPAATMAELSRRAWPGNVRELRNALEHALILARGGPIAPEHLPAPMHPAHDASASAEESLAALVRRWAESQLLDPVEEKNLYARFLNIVEPPLFEKTLERYHGQYLPAARRLGIHRTTLKKKINEFSQDEPAA